MGRSIRGMVLSAFVVLAAMTAGHSRQAKTTPAREAGDLADEAASGKDVSKGAAALKKRFGNVRAAMNVYNPQSRGGVGFGKKGSAIEGKLADLAEKALDADQLKKEAAELTKVAHLTVIMADVFEGYAPAKAVEGRGKKEWKRDTDDVKAGSRSLLEAIKGGDAKAVQAAATRITDACNRCHDGK